MHPAFSVIFFTVASGAGFGLVVLTIALELLGGVSGLSTGWLIGALVVGVLLATAGLLSSTLHLANPRNAWRAFFRFRSSWLSREAVFSVLFYPVTLLMLLGLWTQGSLTASPWITVVALLSMLLALATVFTTGMIYASLRTIPQWNSALVPANYLLLALASGALLLTAVASLVGGAVTATAQVALLLVVIAGASKAVYYHWIGTPHGPTINTAIGMTRGRARLLEAGQSSPSFLDHEFGFEPSARDLLKLRLVVYISGFFVPFLLLITLLRTEHLLFAWLAVTLLLGGLLVERWLFFAEARHTVNLFYGRQQC